MTLTFGRDARALAEASVGARMAITFLVVFGHTITAALIIKEAG